MVKSFETRREAVLSLQKGLCKARKKGVKCGTFREKNEYKFLREGGGGASS